MQNTSKYETCRICHTKENLKFTAAELIGCNCRKSLLKYNDSNQCYNFYSKQIAELLGNTCYECDGRLQVIHQVSNDMQTDDEVEIDVVNCEESKETSVNRLKDQAKVDLAKYVLSDPKIHIPIISNKDDRSNHKLLYNLLVMGKFKHNQQQLQQNANKHMLNDLIAQGSIILKNKPTSELKTVNEHDHRIVAVIDLVENDESILNPQEISNTTDLEVITTNSSQISCNGDEVVHYKHNGTGVGNDDHNGHDEMFSCTGKAKFSHNNSESTKNCNDNKMRLIASLSLVSSDSEVENNDQQQDNENLSSTNVTPRNHTRKRRSHRIYTYKQDQLTMTDRIISFQNDENKQSQIKCPVCEIEFGVIRRLLYHMRYKHRDYNGNVLEEKPRLSQDSSMTIRLRYMQRSTYFECQLCGHIDVIYKEHKKHILEKHPIESKCLKDPFIKQLKCPICKTECGPKYLNLCRHILKKHDYQQYKSHLKQVASIGGNPKSKENIQTAIIYQYTKFKTMFFECKLCHKVVDGYQHHLRHLKKHKDALTAVNINKSKPAKKLATIPKPLSNSKDATKKSKAKTKTKNVETTLTPANKVKEKQSSEVANGKINNRKRRTYSKEGNTPNNLKIVKVKPPVKQVNTQTYVCMYCSKSFLGFRTFNLHLLQQHAKNEFESCKFCGKAFLTINALQKHQLKCDQSNAINKFKSKRKRIVLCKHHLN